MTRGHRDLPLQQTRQRGHPRPSMTAGELPMREDFLSRVGRLPYLGLGPSTEYGAARHPSGFLPLALKASAPAFAQFLEVGVETAKGLDQDTLDWVATGAPTTYHFLDINLDDPEDFDPAWLAEVRALVATLKPAWLCGDAGLWHFGPRERGHMLLLPPLLTAGSASAMAEGVIRLREETGLEVLPENPPGMVFLGELHLLDYFAKLCEAADTGLVLDCAHLAIYQHLKGLDPLTALDGFPLDRVVELHMAGGTLKDHQGLAYIEDDHGPHLRDECWAIFDAVTARAPNLKAVVFECERNPIEAVAPSFARMRARLEGLR